jgi:hypothetical protein
MQRANADALADFGASLAAIRGSADLNAAVDDQVRLTLAQETAYCAASGATTLTAIEAAVADAPAVQRG